MNSVEVIDIGRQTLLMFLRLALPLLLVSLVVGLIISLFQALTQIQEATLTFVPKIVILFITLIFLMPYILHTLTDFTNGLYARIVVIGQSDEEP
jgi:flagellar biosynthetic protein FliQ